MSFWRRRVSRYWRRRRERGDAPVATLRARALVAGIAAASAAA